MKNKFNSFEKMPLHIIGKAHDESWPIPDMDFMWQSFSIPLREFEEDCGFKVHAFVMMSNHYHLLCTYDFDKDPGLLEWFHERVRLELLHSPYMWIGKTFEDNPKVHRVDNIKYYSTLYRYIYRNPVEAGLAKKAEDYPYSTLKYVLGRESLEFHCEDNMHIAVDGYTTLDWINRAEEVPFDIYQ